MSQKKRIPPRSALYRVLIFIFKYPIRFLCNIRVRGAENEPTLSEGPYLVISNHRTWADPIFLCVSLKHQQPHFMAKKELFKIPVLNMVIRALGAYPVNRGGADVGAIRYTIDLLKGGVAVGMFPQGHRYNGVDPRTTAVKTGAAMIALKADVPVLPVCIKVKNDRMTLFGRKEIIIGKPITVAEMAYDPEGSGEYQRIANALFEKVCELGEDRHA